MKGNQSKRTARRGGILCLWLSLAWGLLASSSLAADNPRIAMLWSPAQGSEPRADKMARYDLVLTSPDGIGLEWRDEKHADMAENFVPESIAPARKRLERMHQAHPGVAVVLELYFFEADEENYPPESPWWYRDKQGKKVQFWKGCYNMDVSNTEYREHILKRVAAIHEATQGKAGLFFDNLRFEKQDKAAWIALLGTIRERFGEIPILVNSGWESEDLNWVAPLVNGIMFEDSIAHTSDKNTEAYYARVQELDQKCRQPRLSVNEIFGKRDDAQEMKQELVRTLVYTDAHFLYADSTYGHRHNWWPEWDAPLGAATEPASKPAPQALARREFEGGLVAWLPADAPKAVELELATPLTLFGKNEPVSRLVLEPGSGEILLRKPAATNR